MPEARTSPPTDDDTPKSGEHDEHDERAADDEQFAATDEEPPRTGMTPRQARRVRIVLSGVVMVAVAVALVLRLGSAPSVLTVGFYGFALILSGTAIVLSRRGRTAVATVVLGVGVGVVALAEELLRSAQ
ncbi:MAG: hypothetical protein ACRDP3_27845 [Streptomyces sp.]|uniref:hypothetical protein n=1 Tax=Streptomyces sp. TaxID=1931 RepID=UPI003D6B11EC